MRRELVDKAATYLHTLCGVQPNRRTGSPGNREATAYFASILEPWGYLIDTTGFDSVDYASHGASLAADDSAFDVQVSPYSLSCDVRAEVVVVTREEELAETECKDQILLMKGEICAEQLMPKNFRFYNPDHHKRIVALLEAKAPVGIVTATKRNAELVGALYPFPLLNDGDFDIPSVYCTDSVGEGIASKAGKIFRLSIDSQRLPATACNVIARKNSEAREKVVVTAHIDAYEDSPGALDDGAGIVVLMLLAERLADYRGALGIEIVAFNGEDHYSAGGEMDYLRRYGQDLGSVVVNVNVDDIGYKEGKSVYSFYECPADIQQKAAAAFGAYGGLMAGEPWYQGDHMVFVQSGRPAIAFTADRMAELMATVTHTERDVPDLVDLAKVVEVSLALEDFIRML
jgi:aminopeptidase YwaD